MTPQSSRPAGASSGASVRGAGIPPRSERRDGGGASVRGAGIPPRSERRNGGGPVLKAISPEATPEEVAAIIAAIAELTRPVAVANSGDDTLHEWVHAARLASRRSPLQRGPWRLSGRIGRRIRA